MHKTVVLIDDDSDDLDLMRESLTQVDSSINCVSFVFAEEAIRLLTKELILLPDYIFIDINMPKLDGMECLKQLRSIPEFRETPIIMCSTSMPSTVSEQLIKQGATYTFQKPNTVGAYLTILEGIIFSALTPYRHIK
ncbi:MAG: response regulator [Bacteroidota bacterium]